MSRFKSLAHSVWYCNYHIVFVPKYRFRILIGNIKIDIEESIRLHSVQMKCEIVELNIQKDHVHILVSVPPKISISEYVGTIKGRSAIRIFSKHSGLRKKYWGNRFWARGYCVDTVGINLDMIQRYIKYQDKKEFSQ